MQKPIEEHPFPPILPQIPRCQWLFTTGGKATEILLGLLPAKVKPPKTNEWIAYPFNDNALKLYRLPSSSRAYPLSFAKKVAAYHAFFVTAGLL